MMAVLLLATAGPFLLNLQTNHEHRGRRARGDLVAASTHFTLQWRLAGKTQGHENAIAVF